VRSGSVVSVVVPLSCSIAGTSASGVGVVDAALGSGGDSALVTTVEGSVVVSVLVVVSVVVVVVVVVGVVVVVPVVVSVVVSVVVPVVVPRQ
jgi:hypothetical protein